MIDFSFGEVYIEKYESGRKILEVKGTLHRYFDELHISYSRKEKAGLFRKETVLSLIYFSFGAIRQFEGFTENGLVPYVGIAVSRDDYYKIRCRDRLQQEHILGVLREGLPNM